MAHPTGSRLTPGLCLGQVLCPRICSGLEEWRGGGRCKGEGAILCWDAAWLVIRDPSQPGVCIQCYVCAEHSVSCFICVRQDIVAPTRSWRHAHMR